jgi:hypothetical protein
MHHAFKGAPHPGFTGTYEFPVSRFKSDRVGLPTGRLHIVSSAIPANDRIRQDFEPVPTSPKPPQSPHLAAA